MLRQRRRRLPPTWWNAAFSCGRSDVAAAARRQSRRRAGTSPPLANRAAAPARSTGKQPHLRSWQLPQHGPRALRRTRGVGTGRFVELLPNPRRDQRPLWRCEIGCRVRDGLFVCGPLEANSRRLAHDAGTSHQIACHHSFRAFRCVRKRRHGRHARNRVGRADFQGEHPTCISTNAACSSATTERPHRAFTPIHAFA